MSDECALIEKLRVIERRHVGVAEVEADVAAFVRAQLEARRAAEPAVEVRLTVSDEWAQRLFGALCRRYGLVPYRYRGQRRSTVMVEAPPSFVEATLAPLAEALEREVRGHVFAVTDRVIREALHESGGMPVEASGANDHR
jgi:hypothetical protein